MDIVDTELNIDGYSNEQIKLIKKTEVFPYDYVTSFEKLKETVVLFKNNFYGHIYGSNNSKEEYKHEEIGQGFATSIKWIQPIMLHLQVSLGMP